MVMVPRPARHRYSYDEYLAYERDSGRLATGGWEYHDATEGTVQLGSGAELDLGRLYAQLPD